MFELIPFEADQILGARIAGRLDGAIFDALTIALNEKLAPTRCACMSRCPRSRA